jgi:hypothetical protein
VSNYFLVPVNQGDDGLDGIAHVLARWWAPTSRSSPSPRIEEALEPRWSGSVATLSQLVDLGEAYPPPPGD